MKKNKKNRKSQLSKGKCQMFCAKRKSGFSLIESLVAIFIFSLAAAMLAGAFSGFFKTYVSARKDQRNVESAQYVMNLMAKTIRTGTIDPAFSSGGSELKLFDNSTSTCFVYKYDGVVLKVAEQSGPTDINGCANPALTAFSDLSKPGEISGVTFSGTRSIEGTIVGAIVIAIAGPGGIASQIQTTVSLRDTKLAAASVPTADTTPPTVSAFTVPATSNSLTISGITFTASDNVGVTGYLINESSTPPAASSITLASAPTSYTASTAGAKTLYAWVKDAAGNVSNVFTGRGCTITIADTTPPAVATFTVPATSSSLTISGITLTASDNIGVTGYLINESSTPPSEASITSSTAPTSYTASTAGAKTLYAWVKDAAGNVSNVFTGGNCTITIADTTPPVVATFTVPATSSSLTISGITLTASDNVGVTRYLINESSTPPAASSITRISAPTSYVASSDGTKTLYAWVRDAAGNVSNVFTVRSVVIQVWIAGPCGGIQVYSSDITTVQTWGPRSTYCVAPQCASGVLVADNGVNFSAHPARNSCKTLGGRLPSRSELFCIFSNKASYIGPFQDNSYWSSQEYAVLGTTQAWLVNSTTLRDAVGDKANVTRPVRCVR